MDERGAMVVSEISEYLSLNTIINRKWHICATCATTGHGLTDGFQWLLESIRAFMESKNK